MFVLSWMKKRWKIIAGFVGSIVALMMFYLRSNSQKEILKKANESHKAETEANDKAREDLIEGLGNIRVKSIEDIRKVNHRAEEKKKKLEQKKKDLIDETIESGDIAKKLADSIGADFIETPKE